MGRKKLLEKLQQLFDFQSKKNKLKRKKLGSILNKLIKKKRKLQFKIEHEQDETLLKSYQLELEILNKQLEKGKNALLDNQSIENQS